MCWARIERTVLARNWFWLKEDPMPRLTRSRGFSLVELLLVLAIIGIISAIAIPSFMGQRRRARVIGDAQANARIMAMALEARKAENGIYGTASTTYTWTNGVASDSTFLPTVTLQNASQMNYSIAIGATSLTFSINVTDPHLSDAPVLSINQAGALTLDATYNK
jgi:prepilin-type N-terminal cleavage/methylation domain-containing protein